VIRVVTLDPYEAPHLAKLCKLLYSAFAVGCEHSGSVEVPKELTEPLDANAVLEKAAGVRAYADDKLLYLTARKLKDRELPSGVAPTNGCAQYGKERALITTAGVKDFEEQLKLVGRHALHQLGHLWELHHCLDPRCSMYPPWTPSFANGDSIFCTFCRDKSEQKIRLAKS
jgi:archaemetzincin